MSPDDITGVLDGLSLSEDPELKKAFDNGKRHR